MEAIEKQGWPWPCGCQCHTFEHSGTDICAEQAETYITFGSRMLGSVIVPVCWSCADAIFKRPTRAS